MTTADQHAFVDESGDAHLHTEKTGCTSHYAVAAILTDGSALPALLAETEIVRRRHFGAGEMKSNAPNMDKRRPKILGDIAKLEFGAVVVVVDKQVIDKEGPLQYKRSFLKFINNQLYKRLYGANPAIRVLADEHGSKEFKESFERYIRKRHKLDLFQPDPAFGFENSKKHVLLQLADFVAGTVRHVCTDPSEENKALLRTIERQLRIVIDWPPVLPYRGDPLLDSKGDQHDALVRDVAVNLVLTFLRDHEGVEDLLVQAQVSCLRYLLYHFRYIDSERYVSTTECINHLGRHFPALPLTQRFFRANIIAKLRDKGVIIASTSRGLKLPNGTEDLSAFVEQSRGMIEPMLARLQLCREQMLMASSGRLDVLEHPRYEALRRILEYQPQEPS